MFERFIFFIFFRPITVITIHSMSPYIGPYFSIGRISKNFNAFCVHFIGMAYYDELSFFPPFKRIFPVVIKYFLFP
jgi:hypothetical protein